MVRGAEAKQTTVMTQQTADRWFCVSLASNYIKESESVLTSSEQSAIKQLSYFNYCSKDTLSA